MSNNDSPNRVSEQPAISAMEVDNLLHRARAAGLGGPNNLTPYRADFKRAVGEYSLGRLEEAKSALKLLRAKLEPLLSSQTKTTDRAEAHLLYASTLTWLGQTYEQLPNEEDKARSAFEKANAEFTKWISKPRETAGHAYRDYGVALFKLGHNKRALTAFTGAAQNGNLNADANCYMGVCLESLNKTREAEQRFREALKQDPDHYEARKALARLLERENRIGDAVNQYHTVILQALGLQLVSDALAITEHVLELKKQDPQLLALKGDILRLLNDSEGALETLNRSLKRQPKSAFANGIKGLVLLKSDGKTQGIRLLERALELDPRNDWVPVELAAALCDLGDYERGLSVLNRALRKHPRNVRALIQKGETLSALDRHDDALLAFEKAIELKPNDALLLARKGQVLRHLNQYKKARKVLRLSIELDPRVGWVHAELAAVLYAMGQYYNVQDYYYDALQAVINALVIEPDNVFGLSYKSEILRVLGAKEESVERTEEALQVINQALALSPDDPWALGTKGQVLRDLGRVDEAIRNLQRSISLHPRLGWVHLEYSLAQHSIGNYDKALDAVKKALTLEDDAEWQIFKAQILCDMGDFESALTTLDHVIRTNRKISSAFGLKGWALQHLGERAANNALRAYQTAARLEPDNLWWHKGIANALYLMGKRERAAAKYKWVLNEAERRSARTGDVSLLYLRGWCQYRLGNCKEAVELLKRVVLLSLTETAYRFDLALSLICCERYVEALNEYSRAVESLGEESPSRRRGLILIVLHDLQVAIRMQRSLADVPEVQEALTLLEEALGES